MVDGKNSWMDAIFDPENSGYVECDHCNGYGSSLKDPEGVNKCTKCGGSGLVKKDKKENDK